MAGSMMADVDSKVRDQNQKRFDLFYKQSY